MTDDESKSNTKAIIANIRELEKLKRVIQRCVLRVTVMDLILIMMVIFRFLGFGIDPRIYGEHSDLVRLIISVIFLVITSGILTDVLAQTLIYHRSLGSVKILSATLADETGWYSEYHRDEATGKIVRREKSSSKPSDSSDIARLSDGEQIRAKSVLREVAENLNFPFIESDLGALTYGLVAIAAFVAQVGIMIVRA
jgi:hypothetical protein